MTKTTLQAPPDRDECRQAGLRDQERLWSRVRRLEAALERIELETELALSEPRIAFFVTRRVATLVSQARN
jgi:hypothetical protein